MALNRATIAKSLESLSRVVDALPEAQRRELLHLLIGRLVVKPWEDEPTRIQDGAITRIGFVSKNVNRPRPPDGGALVGGICRH